MEKTSQGREAYPQHALYVSIFKIRVRSYTLEDCLYADEEGYSQSGDLRVRL